MPLNPAIIRTPFAVYSSGPYVGPGDVVASATVWYGLRGYSAAYSNGSNPGIDVCDTATGLITTTVNILSNGNLDTATILGLGYGVSIKKLYDQTGNGYHLTQATLGKCPIYTPNALGTRPSARFTGSSSQELVNASSPSVNQPLTISIVGTDAILAWENGPVIGLVDATPEGIIYAGSTGTGSAGAGAAVAAQLLLNNASSAVYANGTSTTGLAAGAANAGAAQRIFVGQNAFGTYHTGDFFEAGLWSGNFSGGQQSSMNGNQRTYWGF